MSLLLPVGGREAGRTASSGCHLGRVSRLVSITSVSCPVCPSGHCQRPTGTGFKRTFFPLPGSLGTNGRQPPRGHLHRFEVSEKPKDN